MSRNEQEVVIQREQEVVMQKKQEQGNMPTQYRRYLTYTNNGLVD